MKRIIIMSIARGSEEIWPKLTHSSRMIRVHIHSLAALICWIDAKSCLNKECSRCWSSSSYYSCAAAAFYVADGQGDDDDYRLVLLLTGLDWLWLMLNLGWEQLDDRDWVWRRTDGLPACLPGWFSVLGRLARAWNFKWGANNVAVSLCYLSLSCLVDAKWRKVFLKHHRPQKFSSGHLCANTDVLLCTTCAIFGHDH